MFSAFKELTYGKLSVPAWHIVYRQSILYCYYQCCLQPCLILCSKSILRGPQTYQTITHLCPSCLDCSLHTSPYHSLGLMTCLSQTDVLWQPSSRWSWSSRPRLQCLPLPSPTPIRPLPHPCLFSLEHLSQPRILSLTVTWSAYLFGVHCPV